MDLRQSRSYARYLNLIGWKTERIDGTYVFIKKFPFIGSLIKIQRPEKVPSLVKIEKLAREYRAFQISLEPKKQLEKSAIEQFKKRGYKSSSSAFLPTKTLRLDLNQGIEEILKHTKKDCRYCLKKAPEAPLQYIKENNLIYFRDAWRKSLTFSHWLLAPSSKNLAFLEESFGKNSYFLLAFTKQTVLGGTVILIFNKTAYYYYAFTNPVGRKLLAQYFLVWEAIKLAKRKGCQIFDFEGIYDERFGETKKWQGLTHFKKSFGGKEITFPLPLVKTSFLGLN